jgi:hypothetical protein
MLLHKFFLIIYLLFLAVGCSNRKNTEIRACNGDTCTEPIILRDYPSSMTNDSSSSNESSTSWAMGGVLEV